MLQQIQDATDIPHPVYFFNTLYNNQSGVKLIAEMTAELNKEGYMRVRKLVVTPTRKLFLNPELIMGNRSLRQKKADNMLRVAFRDDDNNKVSHLPKSLIERTVTETLKNPVFIGSKTTPFVIYRILLMMFQIVNSHTFVHQILSYVITDAIFLLEPRTKWPNSDFNVDALNSLQFQKL